GLRLRQEGGELYKTAAYTALAAVHEQEMRSEQMRLLYVALTRAQDKLILTLPLGVTRTVNPLEKAAAFLSAGAGPVLYSQCGSFAGWLRAALLVHPNGGPLRRKAGDLQLPFVRTDSVLTLTIPEGTEAAEPPAPPPPTPADPELAGPCGSALPGGTRRRAWLRCPPRSASPASSTRRGKPPWSAPPSWPRRAFPPPRWAPPSMPSWSTPTLPLWPPRPGRAGTSCWR